MALAGSPRAAGRCSRDVANYTSASPTRPFLSSLLRVVVYSLILVPVMLGLALVFALLLDARRVRFQRFSFCRSSCPTRCRRSSPSLLWASCTCSAVSPFPAILGKFGLPMPDLFTTHVALLLAANIGVWGGTGFNMIVMYTALRAVPVGTVRGGAHRRGLASGRSRCGSRSR